MDMTSILSRRPIQALAAALSLLLCVAPSLHAQALPAAESPGPLAAGENDGDTRVLPVWSNASGRVEALLLLDANEPVFATNALERVLATPTGLGLGARMRLDDGARLGASLKFDPDANLALLCDRSPGLASSFGSLGEHCLLANLGSHDPLLDGTTRASRLNLGWTSPDERVDLSFGLSWIDVQPTPGNAWTTSFSSFGSNAGAAAPVSLNALAPWLSRFEQQGAQLDGQFALGPETRLLVGGQIDRSQLFSANGLPLRWNSAALSVGLGFGDFRGQLTGRLIEVPGLQSDINALDIGVSWRTPWRGELSVGARNVLGNGNGARWPLAELPAIDDPSARVPYVRYQQDL